jgi:hypothetical protein
MPVAEALAAGGTDDGKPGLSRFLWPMFAFKCGANTAAKTDRFARYDEAAV